MSIFFRKRARTENLTVLLTDITGFTSRTSAQSREESARWLARHEALLGPVVDFFGGLRRKDIGDAWLMTFASPTDAVRCATAIQDRLWTYNRLVAEEERIEVRAVLTQGEIQIQGGEILGESVTAALKLESEAEAREVLLTESVYLAMNRKEAPTEEIGLREVEGLLGTLRLYRAARVTHGDDGPPYGERSLPPPPQLEIVDSRWLEERCSSGEHPSPRELPVSDEIMAVGRKLKNSIEPIRRAAANEAARPVAMAVGGGLLSVVVLFLLLGGLARMLSGEVPAAERLIDRGRLDDAKAAIRKLERDGSESAADLHYLRGRLAWAEERHVDAAASYRRAIGEDAKGYARDRTIRAHMLEALRHESCPARRGAARTLALTGRRDVVRALNIALEAEAARSRGPLGRLRCDFESAARRAIETLEGGGS